MHGVETAPLERLGATDRLPQQRSNLFDRQITQEEHAPLRRRKCCAESLHPLARHARERLF